MVQQIIKHFLTRQNHVLLIRLKETCKLSPTKLRCPNHKSFSCRPLTAKETEKISLSKTTRRTSRNTKERNTSVQESTNSTVNPVMSVHENAMPSIIQLTEPNSLSSAKVGGEILRRGGIIATPTDTVYGLAADAQNIQAVAKLYEIKGRNPEKPIAICVSEISQLTNWAKVTVSKELLNDFLPGPVTLVFERQPTLNPELNPETNLIGIRIPNHTFIRQLAQQHSGPVALTSANPSSEPSTISPHEFQSLWPYLDCVFDGGDLRTIHPLPHLLHDVTLHSNNNVQDPDEKIIRAGSTVINLSQEGFYSIIREGSAHKKSVELLKEKYHLIEKKDV